MHSQLAEFLDTPEHRNKLSQCTRLYLKPDIPQKKLYNAIHGYIHSAIQENQNLLKFNPEQVLMLFDDTVFGSAKEGFVVTEQFMIFKSAFIEPILVEFEEIKMLSWDNSFLNNNLNINGKQVSTLIQASKQDMRLICTTLQRYVDSLRQTNQRGSQQQQSSDYKQNTQSDHPFANSFSQFGDIDNRIIELKLALIVVEILSYFALYQGHAWTKQKVLIVYSALSPEVLESDHNFRRIDQHLENLSEINIEKVLKQFMLFKPNLEFRTLILLKASQLMLNYFSGQYELTYNFIQPLTLKLDLPSHYIDKVFEALPEFVDRMQNQHSQNNNAYQSKVSSLPNEVVNALDLLGISQSEFTVDTVHKSFRIKVKEFHPDRYQQLPDSVKAMLESKTQELNSARTVLLAYLG